MLGDSKIVSPFVAALGVATSSVTPSSHSGGYFTHNLQERFKRAVTRKWQRRELTGQLFAVIRHAERADDAFSLTNGGRWCSSDDGKRYPLDAPLSDVGKEQAIGIGKMLKNRSDAVDVAIHVVVTSPYARCVETALAIVKANPGARLVIDSSLGEIYGPCVMGSTEPLNPLRPSGELLAHRKVKMVGEWPTWPEDHRGGRLRFASRFLTYLHRGEKAKRNFVLVTHGDCVAAALAMMPSLADSFILGVEYGGLFLATRNLRTSLSSLKEVDDEAAPADPESPMRPVQSTKSTWSMGSESSEAPPTIPKSHDGWEVETVGIQIEMRLSADEKSRRSTMRHLKKILMASPLKQNRIEELLGRIKDGGLECEASINGMPSYPSASTYQFGRSGDSLM